EAGTQVEGDVAARGALAVRIGGRLRAVGTRLQPIVFTCNAATKTPGCWGGLSLNGTSLLNNGAGTGCPVKLAAVNGLPYGGCVVQDTSGTLRYLRIEDGGMARPGGGGAALPSPALVGVGTGTVVDSI